MLFHLGTLKRLNELQMLPELRRISGVSGASILAAHVGLQWDKLKFRHGEATNFEEVIMHPIQDIARQTIVTKGVSTGMAVAHQMLPLIHHPHQNDSATKITDFLDKHLFKGATLQNLSDNGPAVFINATTLETGNMWLFSKCYMGDSLLGYINEPTVKLSDAVAASAAFPVALSPFVLNVAGQQWKDNHIKEARDLDMENEHLREQIPEYPSYATVDDDTQSERLSREILSEISLADGGVYDNLGLDTCWKKFKKNYCVRWRGSP